MTSQENEYFFEHIKEAITALKLGRQRPDNKRILKNVQRSTAMIVDEDYIDKVLQKILKSNFIYNRPTESGPSYYLRTKTVIQMIT